MLIFKGTRTPWKDEHTVLFSVDGGQIWANVPKYLDEVNHSPDGFEWGYGGSGPAQLSYAILRIYFRVTQGDDSQDQARALYQRFKWYCVSGLEIDSWVLSSDVISAWLNMERGKNGGLY